MDEKSKRTTNGGVRSVSRQLFQTFWSEGWIEIDIRRRDLQILPTTTGLYVGQSTYISPITFLRLSCELSQTSRPCRPHRPHHHLPPSFTTALALFQVGECFLIESRCIRISGEQAAPFAVESYSTYYTSSQLGWCHSKPLPFLKVHHPRHRFQRGLTQSGSPFLDITSEVVPNISPDETSLLPSPSLGKLCPSF